MNYNFDEVIDRKNTNSVKHDFHGINGIPDDAIPLWVADMDFRTPAPVIEALVKSGEHGIFGYSETREDYFQVLQQWFVDNYDWDIHLLGLLKHPELFLQLLWQLGHLLKKRMRL